MIIEINLGGKDGMILLIRPLDIKYILFRRSVDRYKEDCEEYCELNKKLHKI